jgi:hypothetical protein
VVHKNALLLDAIEYFFVCLLRYPTLSNAQVSTERTAATDNIYGRAYYPSTARSTPTEILQNRGVSAWVRGVPYLVLLQEYLREYVPVPVPADSEGATTTSATPRKNDNQMVSEHEALQQQRYRELFLHLAVAYWLDSPLVLKTDHHKLGVLRRQLAGGAAGYSGIVLRHYLYSSGIRITKMYFNTDASANSSFLVERAHPGPTELELLDTTSLRCTIGSLQVGSYTRCI